MSQNSGNSNIHLGVTGPMVLTLDAAAAGLPIDFLKGKAASSTRNLAIRSHGDAKAKDSMIIFWEESKSIYSPLKF